MWTESTIIEVAVPHDRVNREYDRVGAYLYRGFELLPIADTVDLSEPYAVLVIVVADDMEPHRVQAQSDRLWSGMIGNTILTTNQPTNQHESDDTR